jgi:hypothetical protein
MGKKVFTLKKPKMKRSFSTMRDIGSGNPVDPNVVTISGGKTLTTTLQTHQVDFTSPKELVTKSYVDSKQNTALGAVTYCGVYNAATNTPDLLVGPHTEGCYFIVSAAGSQPLNGAPALNLNVADWLIRSPTRWEVVEDSQDELQILLAKTAALSVNGRFQTHCLPETNNAVDLGSSSLRWKDVYAGTVSATGAASFSQVTSNFFGSSFTDTQGVNGFYLPIGNVGIQFQNVVYKGLADRICSHDADGTLKGTLATVTAGGVASFPVVKTSTIFAPNQTVGLSIDDTPSGGVSLSGTSYTGSTFNLLNIDAQGLVMKTSATMTPSGDLTLRSITGNHPGPSTDLEIKNQSGVGLTLVDGGAGAIRLTGAAYAGAGKLGQYLQIGYSDGTLVSSGVYRSLVVGNWFQPVVGTVAAGLSSAVNTIYMYPFRTDQTVTINALGARVTTAGVNANFQLAIYASNPTTGLPTGTVMTATSNLSGAAAGAITGVVLDCTLTAGQLYWAAFNCDVAIVAQHLSGASTFFASIVGSSNLTDITSAATISSFLRQVPSPFNTWPDLTGVTPTASSGSTTLRGALVYFKVSSL